MKRVQPVLRALFAGRRALVRRGAIGRGSARNIGGKAGRLDAAGSPAPCPGPVKPGSGPVPSGVPGRTAPVGGPTRQAMRRPADPFRSASACSEMRCVVRRGFPGTGAGQAPARELRSTPSLPPHNGFNWRAERREAGSDIWRSALANGDQAVRPLPRRLTPRPSVPWTEKPFKSSGASCRAALHTGQSQSRHLVQIMLKTLCAASQRCKRDERPQPPAAFTGVPPSPEADV